MPIYAYKCESCDHAKDVLQKISDPLLTVCPACAAATFKKQLTAAGFQLKGSGWYVTDFKGGAAPAAGTPAKEGESAKSEAKSDNKSDNKPESTSTPAPSPTGSSNAAPAAKSSAAAAVSAPAAAKTSAPPATGV